jgi:23S rRNA pseudouridine1911/1915/1917 synthase
MDTESQRWTITAELRGKTVAAVLRRHLPGQTWSEIRRLVETGRVMLGAEVCRDPARRLTEEDTLELLPSPARLQVQDKSLVLRYVDAQVVVVEKPAGLCTVRHPAERDWPDRRKALAPTLEELVWKKLARQQGRGVPPLPRLRIVHRLDKETSGLVVFARTVIAECAFGKQFHAHTVRRRYLAVVPGFPQPGRVESQLVRDRGDGRRGSARLPGVGKKAVTHIEIVERLSGYSLVSCSLETGRTHQIRIHLAEIGHPVCGDRVYIHLPNGRVLADRSGAPRLALHAAELGFAHPLTGNAVNFEMGLPTDLASFIASLRD